VTAPPSHQPLPDAPTAPRQYIHLLSNGLTLVAEFIPNVRSAAMTLLVPAGAASDPETASGSASIFSDWLLRGAGNRDSRQLSAFLDNLGVQRSSQAETVFLRLSASLLGKNLLAVLPVYADIIQRPTLADDGFEPSLDLALQQIEAIEDEPSHKLSIALRQRHYGFPFGRPTMGDKAQLEALTADALRADFRKRFTPEGAILSVAGSFDWPSLKKTVEDVFGDWPRKPVSALPCQPAARATLHIPQETNQVQIGLAYDTVCENSPTAILAQTAINILSGGMGARLFSEIREKQGLCYSVNAGYHSLKDRAAVFGYAGTAPDRAQKTLDSFLVELTRLKQGVTRDELDRSIIGMKARVIMQGESSGARAATLAYDFFHRGRTRTLEEIRSTIESVGLDNLNNWLAANPPGQLTLVTIGPNELTVIGN
jgi:predicted Zn-dependent peptidase